MQIIKNYGFTSLMRNRQFISTFVAFIAIAFTFLGGSVTPSVHAASVTNSPQVIVAVDLTTSACKYSVISTKGHTPISSGVSFSCPPGTIMSTMSVTLSQAQAKHELYIMPLPAHASQNQWKQWTDQVNQLMNTKRAGLRSHSLIPDTSCNDGGQTIRLTSGTYINMYNDMVVPGVTYTVAADCSTIFLDTADVFAGSVPPNNSVYWVQFAYSNYRATCVPVDYQLFPDTDYAYHPNVTQGRGFYGVYVFQDTEIPACFPGGGGPIQNVSIGPLN